MAYIPSYNELKAETTENVRALREEVSLIIFDVIINELDYAQLDVSRYSIFTREFVRKSYAGNSFMISEAGSTWTIKEKGPNRVTL
jgi:hypothetical protein